MQTAYNAAAKDIKKVMDKLTLFLGRYQLQEGPPEHRSATSVVVRCMDKGVEGKPVPVVIKFMQDEQQVMVA